MLGTPIQIDFDATVLLFGLYFQDESIIGIPNIFIFVRSFKYKKKKRFSRGARSE